MKYDTLEVWKGDETQGLWNDNSKDLFIPSQCRIGHIIILQQSKMWREHLVFFMIAEEKKD